MATEKQIAANRANASKGGPKTEEGKKICRLAAVKHGLTCKTLVVLGGESEEEYLTLLSSFTESFKPANSIEQSLIVRLANAHWRSQRKEGVEAGLLDWKIVQERRSIKQAADQHGRSIDHIPQENYLGLSFLRLDQAMERFLRYAAAIDREFHKTLDKLMVIQKLRLTALKAAPKAVPAPQPAKTQAAAPVPASATPTNHSANPEIGTVSQPAAQAPQTALNPASIPASGGEKSPIA